MARDWKPRQPPAKTSLIEIARRYHAAAVALAQTLGVSVQEVLREHRESVTAIFIESGRCELRLPAAVKLPPLDASGVPNGTPRTAAPPGRDATGVPNGAPMPGADGTYVPQPEPDAETLDGDDGTHVPAQASDGQAEPEVTASFDAPEPLPTTVPTGLPCANQRISDLKPAHLRMLLSKVDQLAAHEGRRWQPLLEALAAERAARLAKGQRPKPSLVGDDGHGR